MAALAIALVVALLNAAPHANAASKVVSWNVHSPETAAKIRAVVRRIARARPTVVGMQEVCNQQMEAIARRLRRRHGLRYHARPGTVFEADEACGPYGSAYGQAILSRNRPRNHVNRCWGGPDCPRIQGDEPRGYMAVTTRVAGRKTRVFNTHLGNRWSGCTRRAKVRNLARKARRAGRSIVLGDLNALPRDRTRSSCRAARKRVVGPLYRSMTEADRRRRSTFPGIGKLDYVFLRGLKRRGAKTLPKAPSDHRPLLARVSPP